MNTLLDLHSGSVAVKTEVSHRKSLSGKSAVPSFHADDDDVHN